MPTIRENLIALRDFITNVPVEGIDLNWICDARGCGSTFCVFGWTAASKLFPRLEWDAGLHNVYFESRLIDYASADTDLDVLFGEGSHGALFQYAGDGTFDAALGFPDIGDVEYSQAEQKELAIARINKQLEEY